MALRFLSSRIFAPRFLTALWNGVEAGGVTGYLDVTETGSDTAAFAGKRWRRKNPFRWFKYPPPPLPVIRGRLAATETGEDRAAFAGTVSWPLITGTLKVQEVGGDVARIAGTVEDNRAEDDDMEVLMMAA